MAENSLERSALEEGNLKWKMFFAAEIRLRYSNESQLGAALGATNSERARADKAANAITIMTIYPTPGAASYKSEHDHDNPGC